MKEISPMEQFQKKALLLKQKLFQHIDETREPMQQFFGKHEKFIIFISVSNGEERARVFCGVGNSPESSWLNAINLCKKFLKRQPDYSAWVKVDLVNEIETLPFEKFIEHSTSTRRNYLRQGISFDGTFNLAFFGAGDQCECVYPKK
ncbi:hypothetical protein [Paenibacillus senegalensis]|uniref:hypothetical protein n=1 Tax=Paenibacillus senegalensis TaxID=1465766 RepID=UPI000312BBDD|nr:hypothetical protein [Paenibacillus senegalensis]